MNLREEERWWNAGFPLVAGVDEVGRGPLAGPVVAAAVILDPKKKLRPLARRLRDSKLLTEKQRDELYPLILEHARAYAYCCVSNTRIDEIGILRATKRAMRTALRKLSVVPDIVLVDAVSLDITGIAQKAIIHGDDLVASIAAASIFAKVTRDALMRRYAKRFVAYSFHRHKGYATRAHYAELHMNGPSPIHRKSFAPVALQLESVHDGRTQHDPVHDHAI